MTGAWHETQSATRIGPQLAQLIYETVDAVRRFDRYPPPPGHDSWTRDAVIEVAHTFIANPNTPVRLKRIVATATSEESFERILEAAVRNDFRETARATDTGAALRALRHAVDNDETIITAENPTTWSLEQHQTNAQFNGPTDPLVEAARQIATATVRWSPTSQRRPPIANPGDLRQVLHAILDTAAAPTPPNVVLDVVLQRFPLAGPAGRTQMDPALAASTPDPSTGLLAADIWQLLSDHERLVAGILDEPIRTVAEQTGLSRGAAHRAVTTAKELLSNELDDIADRASVIAAIAEQSRHLQEIGTNRVDSASDAGHRNSR